LHDARVARLDPSSAERYEAPVIRAEGRRWPTALAIVLPLAVSAIVQWPILHGYFYADDFVNFLSIADSGCLRFTVSPMAGHVLAVRNLLICAQYDMFGLHAGPYFACVLATHLLNVALLFQLVRTMTERRAVAAVAATLWGASPLHAEPLSWYAVYGQVLTVTVLLVVLIAVLADVRRRDASPRPSLAAACVGLFAIGVACFGTGIAIALTAPFSLLIAAPVLRRRGVARAVILSAPIVTVIVYFGLQWLGRRLGESAVWDAAVPTSGLAVPGLMASMLVELLRYAVGRLIAGALAGPMTEFGAGSWIALGAVGAIIVAGAIAGGPATRRNVASTALLTLAIYGVVAAGRAGWYAALGLTPARAAMTERYHYAGSAMLVACVAVAIAGLCRRGSWSALSATAVAILAVAQVWGWHEHRIAFHLWPDSRHVVTSRLEEVDAAARRSRPGETVYLENESLPPTVAGVFHPPRIPGTAALALIAGGSDQRLGRILRFEEASEAVLDAHRAPESRWLSRMLVPARVSPTVAPGMPATSACELVVTKGLLRYVRRLLACERTALTGRDDRTTCRIAADAMVGDLKGVACRPCSDLVALAKYVRTMVDLARAPLRCASGSDIPEPTSTPTARRCGETSIDAADELLRRLVACRHRSILRTGTMRDEACTGRVVAAYRARLDAVGGQCGDCSAATIESGASAVIAHVFEIAFCTPSKAM
jgi:hypothetical protein